MNDLKLHICSNVSYWMGTWVDGWMWGCLPDELSSTKNPESIFLSTPKKGRQGLAQLGQLIFCLILLSFDFLSDYQIIFLILVWGSHFLSEFLLSSDFPILILFSPIFFQPPRKRRARPRWENWFMALCKFFAKNRQRLLLTYYQRSREIYPFSLKNDLNCDFMIGMSLSTNLLVLYWKLSKIQIALRYFDIKLT